MSTKNKNNQKKVVKPVAKPAVEEKDKKAPEAPAAASEKPEVKPAEVPTPEVKVETPKSEPAPAGTVKPDKKETPKVEDKPVEDPMPHVDNTVIVPEVVNPSEKKEETRPSIVGSVGANLASLGDPKDRLDKNHQVDLMNMIYKEFVVNPDVDTNLHKVMKPQFDAMALISMVQYNAQITGDLRTLGIKCDMKMGPVVEKMAMELLGIKVTSLPSPDDPKQLMLQFENIPAEVTRTAVQEKKIEEKPIPEPAPELEEKTKIEALQNIFQRKGEKLSMGSNLLTGIEWARKAYSFSSEEKKSVIFANILNKGFNSMLINCFRNAVFGKLNSDYCIYGAHALMKAWCPTLKETEIAEITQVLASSGIEKKIADWNEKAGMKQCDPTNEFTIANRRVMAANAEKVITAILENKEDVVIDYSDGLGNLTVHPRGVRNTLVAAYGDSENLLKDKLNEICKYYVTPIMRLSSYVDKSAYSQK